MNKESNKFIKLRKKRNEIIDIFNSREGIYMLNDAINNNIDNKYLKFIEIGKSTIYFKANKKFRERHEESPTEFHKDYLTNFMSKILNVLDIKITPHDLDIIMELYVEDNKITIEFPIG